MPLPMHHGHLRFVAVALLTMAVSATALAQGTPRGPRGGTGSGTGRRPAGSPPPSGSRIETGIQTTEVAPGTEVAPTSASSESTDTSSAKVSLLGTTVPLGTVLDQLARNHNLKLIVRADVDTHRDVDIPTLRDVELAVALKILLTPLGYSFELVGDNLVVFLRYVRVFRVRVPPLTQEWSSAISNESTSSAGGGGGGGGGGGAPGGGGGGGSSGGGGSTGDLTSMGARVSLSSESSSEGLWAEIEDTVKSLLTEKGTYSISRTAGLVTASDTPESLDAVARYITALNTEMSRQAVVELRIAEVTFFNNLQAGIDWSALFDRLAIVGNLAVSSTLGSNTNIESGSPVKIGLAGVNGNAVLTALEEQGDVSVVSRPNLLVGNNLPAIIQVGDVRSYVSSITIQTTGITGSQTSVNTSTLSDGLIMSLLPRINDDESVSLALSTVLQEVLKVDKEEFGGTQFVQLPLVARRGYSGSITARLGETLIIGGLLTEGRQKRNAGVPFLAKVPIIGVLFGARDDQERRSELVILLTPRAVAPAEPATADPTMRE
jgi:MSHA biogenesis protein MshL